MLLQIGRQSSDSEKRGIPRENENEFFSSLLAIS
jgi:hypothetical protein